MGTCISFEYVIFPMHIISNQKGKNHMRRETIRFVYMYSKQLLYDSFSQVLKQLLNQSSLRKITTIYKSISSFPTWKGKINIKLHAKCEHALWRYHKIQCIGYSIFLYFAFKAGSVAYMHIEENSIQIVKDIIKPDV